MIIGVGIDLVDVERISRAMENPRFVQRVLTAAEQRYCRTPEGVAGRWAAKEAIAKAVGIDVTWQQVEIINGKSGAPEAKILVDGFDHSKTKVHLSITHERGHAAAVVVFEKIQA